MNFKYILPICFSFLCIRYCLSNAVDRCFCKLNGSVDDCSCSVKDLEEYNNIKIYPVLSSLLYKDYFRYFKVDLNRECPFWTDDSRCALKDCHVKGCGLKEIPKGLREDDLSYLEHQKSKYFGTENMAHHPECMDENHGGLGNLDISISANQKEVMQNWTLYDDQQDNFCDLEDDNTSGLTFVDLTKNPERFTGYMGESAHRIWNSIYKENCFNDHRTKYGLHLHESEIFRLLTMLDQEQCLEKRIFYRLISGLHTSISIHLSREYLLKDITGFGKPNWGPNVTEFARRFDPKFEPEGPQRLKNLFFTYLVEMRALEKVAGYLTEDEFYTGDEESDKETRLAVKQLLKNIKEFPSHFDEQKLFRGNPTEAKKLKTEFVHHFRNISRIIGCVGCDKCKLWGTIQVKGMGTALKILFSFPESPSVELPIGKGQFPYIHPKFHLTRSEIVALFNAFGRLSTSINSLSVFKDLMRDWL